MSGLELWSSALCQSGLCQRPAACSLRAPWFIRGAGPAPSPRGRKKPGSLQGRLLTPDLMSPRTGVGCKPGALGVAPSRPQRTDLGTASSPSLSPGHLQQVCVHWALEQLLLCDKPTRERFHYLMFNYYLGNGLELPRALLRRVCPRQTPSVGLWGPSPAVLVVAGRRAGGGQCSGLKSAAPCSWELALVSLETPVLHLKICCLYLGLQFLCPATQETLRSLWGVN